MLYKSSTNIKFAANTGSYNDAWYVQCTKAREENFQFWKLLAVVLDIHIKCVGKVPKRSESTLVMLPLN